MRGQNYSEAERYQHEAPRLGCLGSTALNTGFKIGSAGEDEGYWLQLGRWL